MYVSLLKSNPTLLPFFWKLWGLKWQCISSTFTVFLPYGPDYVIPLYVRIKPMFVSVQLHHLVGGMRSGDGCRYWMLVRLYSWYLALWYCPREWMRLKMCILTNHEPTPSAQWEHAPFLTHSQALYRLIAGTVCLHFSSLAGVIISWFQWRSCISHPI